MATDHLAPGPPPRSGDPAVPRDPGAPRRRTRLEALTSTTSISLIGSLVLGPAVLVAALSRNFGLGLALLVVVALVVVAVASGFRSFVHVFVFACVLRPLVDLSAGTRGNGVSFTQVFGIGVLAVMSGWLILHRAELRPRLLRPLPLALLSLVGIQVLATLGSTAPGEGLATTLRMAAGVAAFLVTDLLLATGRLTVRHVVQLVVTVSALPLLYPLLGLVGVTVTANKDDVTALKSVFYLSNNFAYFLVPLVILGTAWILRTTGATRYAALAYTAVVGVELILTETRGAWLCGALGALVVCLLLDRRIAVLAILGMVLVVLFVPSVNARIADLAPNPDQPRTQSSLAWRFDQWEGLVPSIQSAPVLGGGPGEAFRLTGKDAHNDYLKALIDTGVIGLGVYLWLLWALLSVAWRAVARVGALHRDTRRDPLLVATLAGVAGYAVAIVVASAGDNLIDNVTFLWSTLPLFAVAQWALSARDDQLDPVGGDAR